MLTSTILPEYLHRCAILYSTPSGIEIPSRSLCSNPLSVQELSAALGWTPEEVEDLRTAVQPSARLQPQVTEDGDALQDLLADAQALQPEDLVIAAQVRRRVGDCVARHSDREALIMRLRYGLDTDKPQTLQEIGACLGVSRERVRQLEQQALAKLRQLRHSAGLAELAR